MGLQLYINGKEFEISDKWKFQFNYQMSDIFDISKMHTSYSSVFLAPRTPNNTQTLGGLGLVGNNSQIPYIKNSATVKHDGFDIVEDGVLQLQEVGVDYQIAVTGSLRNFWDDYQGKTIGKDLDISALKHEKTMENFKSSLNENSLYRYVVANFGGKTALPNGVINIDYLIPVVKLSYFWNKIFETFGYTYSGTIFSNPDFTDAYITYPNAPDSDGDEVLLLSVIKGDATDNNPVQIGQSGAYAFPDSYNWDTSGSNFTNWSYVVPADKSYRFRFKPSGYIQYGSAENVAYWLHVYKGDILITSFKSQHGTADFDNYYIDLDLLEGNIITFTITSQNVGRPTLLHLTSLEVGVYELSTGNIDFSVAFSDFEIRDFVKEIVWRYALIPLYDTETKNVHFLTIDEKVNFNNYVDWTNKYVERDNEMYLYGNTYAQTNIFQHKYNDEGDSFNNGRLIINNANLAASKVIVSSKIYSAEQRTLPIGDQNKKTNIYPIWRGETREDSNSNLSIDYKGLNGRYYIMKLNRINEPLTFKSEVLNSVVETTPFYLMPNANNTHYNDLVTKYYPTYEKIMNNFKMHEIHVALSLPDILSLDLTKLYYFEQEASFYILNKLQWEEGKTCKGEFIKINT